MNQYTIGTLAYSRLFLFSLIFLVTLGKYNLYIGFALKPYMLFLGVFIVIYLSSFHFHKLQTFELALLFFFLVYIYSGVFSLYSSSSLRMIIGIVIYLGFYFITKGFLGFFEKKLIEKAIGNAGVLFNSLSLLLYGMGIKANGFSFVGDGIIHYGALFDRNYPRLIGLLQDPNYYVFYNTLFFTYFLSDFKSRKNKIGLMLCVITSILTFSRGGLLVLATVFLLYFILSDASKKLKLSITSILLGFLILAVTSFTRVDIIDILLSRFGDFSKDGGSGRFELWGRAWEFFSENIFWGIGAFNFYNYNAFEYGDQLVVHNTFLEVLTESGVIGFLAYAVFVMLAFFQIFQSKLYRTSPFLLLTLLGFLMQMMFLSLIVNDMFLLYLAILSTFLRFESRSFQPELKEEGL